MKYQLELIAFIVGALGMTIELAGSRLIAPYLGTSIFVWTSLIGTVLASLSVGYYVGGILSKTEASVRRLADILITATIFSSCVLFAEAYASFFFSLHFDTRIVTLLVCVLVFAPVTICLGMVTPYLVRLKAGALSDVGFTAGRLYAIATLGSIVGTFLGGYVLISYFGTRAIFIGISSTMLLLYLFVTVQSKEKIFTKRFLIALGATGVMIASFFGLRTDPTIISDTDSMYNRWILREGASSEYPNHRVRYLTNGREGEQSGVDLEDPTNLIFPYLKTFDYAAILKPNFKHSLLIGAGGYTYPTYLIGTRDDVHIDVVEIDPSLRDIARKFFFYKDDPRIGVFEEDGRMFLNKNTKQYDVIYVDAFSSNLSMPFQLTTIEAVTHMKRSLSPTGILIVNILNDSNGRSKFLKSEYATYSAVFPQVIVSRVDSEHGEKEGIHNVVLIASASTTHIMSRIPNRMNPSDLVSDFPILRDDFAPVESY